MQRLIVIATALAALACGPKDVIPNAPNHPANPGAGIAPPADAHDGGDNDAIAAAELAALAKAKPVFDKYCVKCHATAGEKSSAKAMEHFAMDSYPFGGHHAMTIGAEIREVLGATGEAAKMPKDQPGAVKGDELAAILDWSKAFDAAHAAGLHHHGGDSH